MSTARHALSTGLVLGGVWGALEAGFVTLGPWFRFWESLGRRPPLDLEQTAQVLLLGAVHNAALLSVALLILLPLWQLLRAARDGAAGGRRAVLVSVTLIVFLNIYWHTKSEFAFTDGLPFTHPSRLAMGVAQIAVALLFGWALSREGRGLRAPRRGAGLLALALLALGGGWAWQREASLRAPVLEAPPAGSPNVVFIVVDALRADRLGVYGHEREPAISPRVDALAAQGVVFDKAWAQAPFTWTSFGSFLTGKYPREHGLIKMSPDLALDPQRNRTVALALQEAGYATGAFMTGTLSNSSGLLHGFDTYFETNVGHEAVHRRSKWSVVRSRMLLFIFWNKLRQALDPEIVNTEAERWIRAHAERPFFALIHYYSTHTPFAPLDEHRVYADGPESPWSVWEQSWATEFQKSQKEGACRVGGCGKPPWTCGHFDPERDVPRIRALYDGGVHWADAMTGEILDLLDELDLADDTLVVFSSDHGEELYDHAVFEHDWMFETNLHVPLVMRLPGREHAGTRVSWPVEMIDIPATILAVTGVGRLEEGGGANEPRPLPMRSLLPDMAGVEPTAAERIMIAENVRYLAVSDGKLKLVANRFAGEERFTRSDGARLFDHATDPDELHPLWPDDAGFAVASAGLREALEAHDARMPRAVFRSGKVASEDERANIKALVALGYLGVDDSQKDLAEAAASGALDDMDDEALSKLLGDTSLLGSNHMLEESLYEWPYAWPPKRPER